MDGDTHRLFQRVADKLGWMEKGDLEAAEEQLIKKVGKTRRHATSGGGTSQSQDLPSPARGLRLDSGDEDSGKENQVSKGNHRGYRDKVLIESSDDDFEQFLLQKATPKATSLKPRSCVKEVRLPVLTVSSDSDGTFEAFLDRAKTPKAKPARAARSSSEDSLKKFIVDSFSSDDDFIIEKPKPTSKKPPSQVSRTPRTLAVKPPPQRPLSQCDSPVLQFLSDSDDDDDGIVMKSTWRTRRPPRKPSSQPDKVKVQENRQDISPSFSPSPSPLLPPSSRAPTPSPLPSFLTPGPTSAHPPQKACPRPPQLEASDSSEEEFLSLLERLKKNHKTSSATPKHDAGSNQKPPVLPPPAKPQKGPGPQSVGGTPLDKPQKRAGPQSVGGTPLDMKTPVRPPVTRPTVSQTEPRPGSRVAVCKTPGCFLQSLSTSGSSNTRGFKQTKEDLTSRLYQLYNTSVFDSKLPADMSVKWNKKMRKTAGYCISGQERAGGKRYARIELSEKVCDSADRLRDTLIHEMCHAATWLINGVRDGHGSFWKLYARKATLAHPELPMVTRCHSYDINYKYQYQCSRCKNTIGRHSKSLDTQRFQCALCMGGQLVLLTPANATPRAPTPFASFVKENYGSVRRELAGQSHAIVMRKLSADFATKTKLSQS